MAFSFHPAQEPQLRAENHQLAALDDAWLCKREALSQQHHDVTSAKVLHTLGISPEQLRLGGVCRDVFSGQWSGQLQIGMQVS